MASFYRAPDYNLTAFFVKYHFPILARVYARRRHVVSRLELRRHRQENTYSIAITLADALGMAPVLESIRQR